MIIELLKFRVCPQIQDQFIKLDRQIWTSMLKNCDGFIDKEVWVNLNEVDEIICLIKWESRQKWKAIPLEKLILTEKEFAQKMGETSYQLTECLEYQPV